MSPKGKNFSSPRVTPLQRKSIPSFIYCKAAFEFELCLNTPFCPHPSLKRARGIVGTARQQQRKRQERGEQQLGCLPGQPNLWQLYSEVVLLQPFIQWGLLPSSQGSHSKAWLSMIQFFPPFSENPWSLSSNLPQLMKMLDFGANVPLLCGDLWLLLCPQSIPWLSFVWAARLGLDGKLYKNPTMFK